VNYLKDTVRVSRGRQVSSYVVAEERDDGSLLLRPDTSGKPIVESAPGRRGSAVAEREGLLENPRNGSALAPNERQPEYAAAARSKGTPTAVRQPSVILEVRDLSVAYGGRQNSARRRPGLRRLAELPRVVPAGTPRCTGARVRRSPPMRAFAQV
jgi:hypothetical protein